MSHGWGKNEPYVFAGKRPESGLSHSLAAPPGNFNEERERRKVNGSERLIFTPKQWLIFTPHRTHYDSLLNINLIAVTVNFVQYLKYLKCAELNGE